MTKKNEEKEEKETISRRRRPPSPRAATPLNNGVMYPSNESFPPLSRAVMMISAVIFLLDIVSF